MTTDAATSALPALTDAERAAELSPEQLRQLVGLVEYDASSDPFPVTGWDAVVWIVGCCGGLFATPFDGRLAYGVAVGPFRSFCCSATASRKRSPQYCSRAMNTGMQFTKAQPASSARSA